MTRRLLIIFSCLFTGVIVYALPVTGLIRNYLPDILWAFAICQTAILMQENKFHQSFIYVLLLQPFITEAGQLPGIFPGTFDVNDLLVYSGLYTIFFYSQIIQLCKKTLKGLSPA